MRKSVKKLKWDRGIRRINFPILFKGELAEAVMKEVFKLAVGYKLPKHDLIGMEIRQYTGKKKFTVAEVYIERFKIK